MTKSKSLRHVIRKPVRPKDIQRIICQTLEGDLRCGIIRNTAVIERGLERHLRARMRKLTTEDNNALFGPNGALSTMSAKIRMAYSLGIIGPVTRHDLTAINDIRNVYAHSPFDVRLSNKYLQTKVLGIRMFHVVEKHGIPELKDKAEEIYAAGYLIYAIACYGTFLSHDRPKRMFFKTQYHTWYGMKGVALKL